MSDDFGAIMETGGAAAAELAASALASHGNCRNCAAPVTGAYCGHCGQERDTHRRSVYRLVRDLVEDLVSFDSRTARTGFALLFKPGELPRAFHDGRTHRYTPALRLYFFVSLIFFLLLSAFNIAIVQMQVVATPIPVTHAADGNYYIANPAYDSSDPDSKKMFSKMVQVSKEKATRPGGIYGFNMKFHYFAPIGTYKSSLPPGAMQQLKDRDTGFEVNVVIPMKSPAKANVARAKAVAGTIKNKLYGSFDKIVANPAAMNGPLTTWIPRILFLLMPLYALILAIFYWRQRKHFYYVDHLIFSLSVHTFFFVVLIADVALAQLLDGTLVFWLTIAALGVYIFLSMKRFYEQSWFWTTVKFCLVSFFYTAFCLAPAVITMLSVEFMGGSLG